MPEKIEPCFYCGCECEVLPVGGIFRVRCTNDDYECGYRATARPILEDAIGVHNIASIDCYRPEPSEPPITDTWAP